MTCLDGAGRAAANGSSRVRNRQSAPPGDKARPGPRWSPRKMAEFLRMLAATHSVSAAARSVGMSRQSAYKLRSRLKGKAFDTAWDEAFSQSYRNLPYAALDRALNGYEVPHYYKGELIGTSRRYDERLTVALLRMSSQSNVLVVSDEPGVSERHGRAFEALLAAIEADGEDATEPPNEHSRANPANLSPGETPKKRRKCAAFGAAGQGDGVSLVSPACPRFRHSREHPEPGAEGRG